MFDYKLRKAIYKEFKIRIKKVKGVYIPFCRYYNGNNEYIWVPFERNFYLSLDELYSAIKRIKY